MKLEQCVLEFERAEPGAIILLGQHLFRISGLLAFKPDFDVEIQSITIAGDELVAVAHPARVHVCEQIESIAVARQLAAQGLLGVVHPLAPILGPVLKIGDELRVTFNGGELPRESMVAWGIRPMTHRVCSLCLILLANDVVPASATEELEHGQCCHCGAVGVVRKAIERVPIYGWPCCTCTR